MTTRRCSICYSPHHQHTGNGPVCRAGFRRDYTPGLHDPHTGEVKKRKDTDKIGQWIDGRWVVSKDWLEGAK